jgi:hypothetical protein
MDSLNGLLTKGLCGSQPCSSIILTGPFSLFVSVTVTPPVTGGSGGGSNVQRNTKASRLMQQRLQRPYNVNYYPDRNEETVPLKRQDKRLVTISISFNNRTRTYDFEVNKDKVELIFNSVRIINKTVNKIRVITGTIKKKTLKLKGYLTRRGKL